MRLSTGGPAFVAILFLGVFLQTPSVQAEEIVSEVDLVGNRVRMKIMITGNCAGLSNEGRETQERVAFQFQTHERSQGIVQQARLTFQNRLRESLGDGVSVGEFNMTYRYELQNQTFGVDIVFDINGPVSFNGSAYVLRAHWRWINASGEFEFQHEQRRYNLNFAKMMALDLSSFNVPLEQWIRERDMTRNVTRYSLTVAPFSVATAYGSVLVDPTQVIETPGETYALGDLIQSGSVPIPEFASMPILATISLIFVSLFTRRKCRKKPSVK